MSMFDQVKVPIIGIVENMSYYQPNEQSDPVYLFGKGGGERLASESGIPLLGKIPLDPYLGLCGDNGESLFAQDLRAQRPVTRAFQQFAQQLTDHIDALKEVRKEGLGSFELIWKEMGP